MDSLSDLLHYCEEESIHTSHFEEVFCQFHINNNRSQYLNREVDINILKGLHLNNKN